MLSCSNFSNMMSLTSELTRWFRYIHALKSHLPIVIGPQQTEVARAHREDGGTFILWHFTLWPFVLGNWVMRPSLVQKFLPQKCSGCFDPGQRLLWLVATWQSGTTGQKWVDYFSWICWESHSQYKRGRMSRKLEHAAPHCPSVVPSIQQMFTQVPLCFLIGDSEGECWVPMATRGSSKVPQRIQKEELDVLRPPSNRLTRLNLTLLIKTTLVLVSSTVYLWGLHETSKFQVWFKNIFFILRQWQLFWDLIAGN